MTPKLVIFDCDGVLVDTETITAGVISENLARYGLKIAPEEVHDLFQGGTMISAGEEAVKRGATLPDNWIDIISVEVDNAMAKGVRVFDGVIELVDALIDRGVAIAIASNGPFSKMKHTLGPSGLWDRFEGRIYSGRAFGAPKPRPEMLLAACEQAGVGVEEAIMIDDTTAGTRAADAAGMAALGYAEASDANKLKATGHPVVFSMQEVRTHLGV